MKAPLLSASDCYMESPLLCSQIFPDPCTHFVIHWWWVSYPLPPLCLLLLIHREEKESFWIERECFSNFCCSIMGLCSFYLDQLFWSSFLLTLKFLSFSLLSRFFICTYFSWPYLHSRAPLTVFISYLWLYSFVHGCNLKTDYVVVSPAWGCISCDCRGQGGSRAGAPLRLSSFLFTLQTLLGSCCRYRLLPDFS